MFALHGIYWINSATDDNRWIVILYKSCIRTVCLRLLWLGSFQQPKLKIFREFQIRFRTITRSVKYNLNLIPSVQSIWYIIYKIYYSCSFTPIIWMHDWMTFWYSHESFNVLFWLYFGIHIQDGSKYESTLSRHVH